MYYHISQRLPQREIHYAPAILTFAKAPIQIYCFDLLFVLQTVAYCSQLQAHCGIHLNVLNAVLVRSGRLSVLNTEMGNNYTTTGFEGTSDISQCRWI